MNKGNFFDNGSKNVGERQFNENELRFNYINDFKFFGV